MRTLRSQPTILLFLLPLGFLLVFYFYPVTKIGLLSFFGDGTFHSAQLGKLFSSTVYLRVIWFTIWQAVLSTMLTLLFGLPGAFIFVHYRFHGKNLLRALMGIPFVLPTVVTAAAFRALLDNDGLLNRALINLCHLDAPPIKIEQSIIFFLLAHIFYNYTLVIRIVGGYWAGLDTRQEEAARTLGCSPWQSFLRVTLPRLLPSIGSAALLTFIFCFTSFGLILILGGPGYTTIEVEIYRQAVQLFNLPLAAALSLIQIAINFLLMWQHARLTGKTAVPFYTAGKTLVARSPRSGGEKLFVSLQLIFMMIMLSPLLALAMRSITGESGLTLEYYRALFTAGRDSLFFVDPILAMQNSIGFGLAAMAAALLLGLSASVFLAERQETTHSFWDAVIMLPLATSAVTLGFGFIISLDQPPLNLRDSALLVVIAHTLVAFPFVVRSLLPGLRDIPRSLGEAAIMLGCSPARAWMRIHLPLLRLPLLVGAIFSFAISMGEFGASAFVTRPHTPTMPIAIFRFLGQPGAMNYGQAMAMSTLLMLVTCCSFLLLDRVNRKSFT